MFSTFWLITLQKINQLAARIKTFGNFALKKYVRRKLQNGGIKVASIDRQSSPGENDFL